MAYTTFSQTKNDQLKETDVLLVKTLTLRVTINKNMRRLKSSLKNNFLSSGVRKKWMCHKTVSTMPRYLSMKNIFSSVT